MKNRPSQHKEINELQFPDELYGVVIEGIDVQILALDSLRILDYYAKNHELSEIQLSVLKSNHKDLKVILSHLTGSPQGYFKKIEERVTDLLNRLNQL